MTRLRVASFVAVPAALLWFGAATFSYDPAALPGAKPWTSVYKDVLFVVLDSEDPPRAAPEGMEEKIETYNRLQTEDPEKGASFHHEGPGNVDHIMWVTMTDAGPKMANIALKGVFDRKGLDPELFGAYDRKGAEG